MELTLWTYEGPPHVGAMRIASSMKDIHYVLHAPQGDTYADLLFTMIERRGQRPLPPPLDHGKEKICICISLGGMKHIMNVFH